MFNINNYVDKIFIISLYKSTERQKEIKKNLKKININENNYHLWLSNKHDKGSVYGSYLSHINVMKYSLKKKWNRILILEDDAYFDLDKITLQKSNDLKNFFKKNKKWGIFYFGGMPIYKYYNINRSVQKGEWILIHSYIINKKAMKYIVNHKEILPHKFSFADYFFNLLYKINKYGFSESICFQTDSPGDNTWPIYLNFYKNICYYFNFYIFKKTTIYVMIVLLEIFFTLLSKRILKFINKYKTNYNIFRYHFYNKYGKKIPYFIYHYFLPL